MIAHSCTSNFVGSSWKRSVETIRLAISHSGFCHAGRSGSSSLDSSAARRRASVDGFHPTCVEIQKGERLIELHLQSVDDVVQANSCGHGFETIILLCTANPRSDLRVRTHQQKQMREFRKQRKLPSPYSWSAE